MARAALVVLLALPSVAALPAQEAAVKPPAKDTFAAARAARDGDRYRMLLRQFRGEEPGLAERHEAGQRAALAEYRGQRDLPAAHWVWVRPYWFLFRDGPGEAMGTASWGPEQACGAPDTPEAGDHGSAWASREQDAPGEWLLLEYAAPVRATKLEVHETFNPGALERVTIFNQDGDELEVWKAPAVGAAAEPKRALVLDLPLGFTVERVKLHLLSEKVPGWNEIDAVGLHDDKGVVHWAARAEANTTFADAGQREKLVRGVVAVRARPVLEFKLAEVQVAQRVAAEQVLVEVLRVRAKEAMALDQALALARKAAPGPGGGPAVIPPPPAPAAAAVDVLALEARIAALEAELARLRAELAKRKAEAKQ